MQDVEADAAASDDGDGTAGLDFRAEHRRSEAGGDAAADEGGLGEGEVGGDFHAAGLRDDGLLREAGDLPHVGDAAPVPMEAARAVEHIGASGDVRVAEVGASAEAGGAMAAVRHEREDDAVAGGDAGHAIADLFDDGGAFVAEHGGLGDYGVAAHIVEVAAADAGGGDADADLICLRGVEIDLLNAEGLIRFHENGGLHSSSRAA